MCIKQLKKKVLISHKNLCLLIMISYMRLQEISCHIYLY